jgi:hypothetical protein
MDINRFLFQISNQIVRTQAIDKKSNKITKELDRLTSLPLKGLYTKLNPEGRFVVRVDDYPRLDHKFEDFKKFHLLTKKYRIDFLLCVSPYENFYGSDIDFFKSEYFDYLLKEQIEFGLHGLTHQRRNGKSEILLMGTRELGEKIEEMLDFFTKYSNFRKVFIPPFNHLDYDTFIELSRHFEIVTGGPETLELFGVYPPMILNSCAYLPSYYGFYGRSKRINDFLKSGRTYFNNLMPITLHWSWESKDDFKNLKILLQNISGKTRTWKKTIELFKTQRNSWMFWYKKNNEMDTYD